MAVNKRKILETAQKYLQKGALDRALKEYRTLLELDPRDSSARLKLGDIQLRLGDKAEAVAAYLKVAQQFMKEGFDAKAVALFKQIAKLAPEQTEVFVPLAELYQRLGLVAEAMSALQTATEGFQRAGRKREALELLRKAASLDPSNTTSRLKIADLLRQQGMNAEALAEYDEVASELERAGEADSLAAVYERILEIEPDRVPTALALARLSLASGAAERAHALLEHAVAARPDLIEALELHAETLQALGRPAEQTEPVFRRLAEAHRARGNEERAREILQRFLPACDLTLSGIAPLAEAPSDGAARDVGFFEPSLAETASPAPPAATDTDFVALDAAGENESFVTFDPAEPNESPATLDPAGASRPLQTLDAAEASPSLEASAPAAAFEADPRGGAATSVPDADIEQLVAEAGVYLRFGKRERAIASLEAVLAREPGHAVALERLAAVLDEAGEAARAAELRERAASFAPPLGDELPDDLPAALDFTGCASTCETSDAAELPEVDLGEFVIEHDVRPDEPAAAPEAIAEDAAVSTWAEPADAVPEAIPDLELEVELDLSDACAPATPEQGDAAAPASPTGLADGASDEAKTPSGGAAPKQILEELEEAEFYVQQGLLEEAEVVFRRVLEMAPTNPQALLRLGEIAAARGDDPAAGHSPCAPIPDLAVAIAEATATDVGGAALGDDLAEWDDLATGSAPAAPAAEIEVAAAEDAVTGDETEALASAEEEAPGEIELAAPALLAGEEAAPADAGSAQEPSHFDLAAELSDALETESPAATDSAPPAEDSLEAIFNEFKRGVRKTLTPADHETHYDLGIAYREMGLVEDAMGEFEIALESPSRRIDCLHLLGVCARELKRPHDAVAFFEQALAEPELAPGRRAAIRFDLAIALEERGDLAAALAAFEEVAADEPSHPGLAERIEALRALSALTPPKSADGEAEPAEVYESFDDLIAHAEAEVVTAAAGAAATQDRGSPDGSDRPPAAPAPGTSPRRRKISFG